MLGLTILLGVLGWIVEKKNLIVWKIKRSKTVRSSCAKYNVFVKRYLMLPVKICKAYKLKETLKLRNGAQSYAEAMQVRDVRCTLPQDEFNRSRLCEDHSLKKKKEWSEYHRVDYYERMYEKMRTYEKCGWTFSDELQHFREALDSGKTLAYYQAEELHLRLCFNFKYRKTFDPAARVAHEARESYLMEGCKYDYKQVSLMGVGPRTEYI